MATPILIVPYGGDAVFSVQEIDPNSYQSSASEAGGITGSTNAALGDTTLPTGFVGSVGKKPSLALRVAPLAPVAGKISIDVSMANTFAVSVSSAITSVELSGFPEAGKSARVTIYFKQGATVRSIGGWPTSIKWQFGVLPVLSTTPNATDCIVFDCIDGGQTIYGSLVGLAYS